jgi:hypothetical protein
MRCPQTKIAFVTWILSEHATCRFSRPISYAILLGLSSKWSAIPLVQLHVRDPPGKTRMGIIACFIMKSSEKLESSRAGKARLNLGL